MKKKVAVVGARGYAGLDLCSIMLKHPNAELAACFTREENWHLSNDINDDKAAGVLHLNTDDIKKHASEFDTVFLATPPAASIELAGLLRDTKVRIIDLSGGFRLEKTEHAKWYGSEHKEPEMLEKAVYGLSPWADPAQIKKASLISNPGCYATSVLMSLIPLLKSGIADTQFIAIDSKSGTSGAGRKPNEDMLLSEVYGNILPYRIGKHQHLPEICRYSNKFSGIKTSPFFNTQVIPVNRGISSAIYSKVADSSISDAEASDKLQEVFDSAYGSYPLVRFAKVGLGNAAADKKILSIKMVACTPMTYIGWTVLSGKIYLFSAIDNLLKGAASQAVENWNIANNYPVHTGLLI